MRRPAPAPRVRGLSLAVVLLGAFFLVGCEDSAVQPTGPDVDLSAVEARELASSRELGPALAAQRAHTDRLMALDGVVGTAVGLTDAGEGSVVVYTVRPGVRGVPETLDVPAGPHATDVVPVKTVVTGLFEPRTDPTTRARPAPLGFSVSHPDVTAGSIGARVRDGNGNVFVLSNNHILANSNDADLGDPALQPGSFDGGEDPEDRIGELYDFEPIDFEDDNTIDAAIASTTTDDVSSSSPTDVAYGQPGQPYELDSTGDGDVDDGVVGLAVQKYGRTTELTQGEVAEINVIVEVCFETRGPFMCARSATFVDQIAITPGDFSDGGDSGSLIVTDDSEARPVSLLFAGSSTRTLGNRIDLVLERFGVEIDDGTEDDSDNGNDNGETNEPPTATFTHDCVELSCEFDGSESFDPDGTIESHDWDFGDGNTGSGEVVSHTYDSEGTFTVTLTVTDDDGATDTDSQNVTVEEGIDDDPEADIELTATAQKVRGIRTVDLSWSGATSDEVDVFRNGDLIATVDNDVDDGGEYTDDLGRGGGGSFTYQVCEAGTGTCSNEATVTF